MTSRFVLEQEFIATRSEGAQIRRSLEQKIRGVPSGEVFEISFANVRAITGSATDEFLGKLLTGRQAGDLPNVAFLVTGLNDETAFEIDLCLGRRQVPVAARVGRDLMLLGGDDYLKATFARAANLGEFNAAELAEDLKVTPQNMNNRLRRLVLGGALLRERSDPDAGGKQYVYRVPVSR